MITIGKPYIRRNDGNVFYCSIITDEKSGLSKEIFYKTTEEYGNYFTDELSDSFLVAMLVKSIGTGQDIKIEGFISERLYYTLTNTIVGIIAYTLSTSPIKILFAEGAGTKLFEFNPTANVTGCSMGVDSFASILYNFSEECPEGFRLTHLSFLNVGSYGKSSQKSVQESFKRQLSVVRKFADEIHLPVVTIESNMDEMNLYSNLSYSYALNNASAYLSMQRLFRRCYMASSYVVAQTEFKASDPFHYENILFYNLSSENTEIMVSNPNMSRIEKTRYISSNYLVKKYLNVCLHDAMINEDGNEEYTQNISMDRINCSKCYKCRRTLLTLDVLGVVEEFSQVFNLDTYYKNRDKYVAFCLYTRHKDVYNKEIYDWMQKNNYEISFKAKLYHLALELKMYDIFGRVIRKRLYS